MVTPSSPTARRYELARRPKEPREVAGKSLADVAEELSYALAKASRIETGQRAVQALDIMLCRRYGVAAEVQAELIELAAEARKRHADQVEPYRRYGSAQCLHSNPTAVETTSLSRWSVPVDAVSVGAGRRYMRRGPVSQPDHARAELAEDHYRVFDYLAFDVALSTEESLQRDHKGSIDNYYRSASRLCGFSACRSRNARIRFPMFLV